jgi:hypothetical protein
MFEVVGYVGIGISLAAYLPQISHLALEQRSPEISRRAWLMWVASSLLVGAVAVQHRELPTRRTDGDERQPADHLRVGAGASAPLPPAEAAQDRLEPDRGAIFGG